ncbi:hypothetical protein J7438_06820 [Thalassotalea sp. G20_0]|nr:hypothetical protein [Thalassotalea sp. G20_0]
MSAHIPLSFSSGLYPAQGYTWLKAVSGSRLFSRRTMPTQAGLVNTAYCLQGFKSAGLWRFLTVREVTLFLGKTSDFHNICGNRNYLGYDWLFILMLLHSIAT